MERLLTLSLVHTAMIFFLLVLSATMCMSVGRMEDANENSDPRRDHLHRLELTAGAHGDLRHKSQAKRLPCRAASEERQFANCDNTNIDLYKLFVCPAFLVPGRIRREIEMFSSPEQWLTVSSMLAESKGAYHFHDGLLRILGPGEAKIIADFFKQRPNISVSIEAGVYLCNGTDVALTALQDLRNYTSVGGRIDQWALESIFSRTMSGCEGKFTTFQQVAEQAVDYVQVLKKAMPDLEFGVIDAVPHFSAGKYPSNNEPRVDLGDIRDALSTLKTALAGAGTELLFYWADCPYEYSLNLPGNTGFEKLAFIANYTTNELGMRMGKIFNSQQGGSVSDKMYYDRSLLDYHAYMSTSAAATDTSDIIAESWYKFPAQVIPETQPYTFMYTAKTILELARNHTTRP
ncbi:uncharacterized protein LOC135809688 [Sycon ciliatum]|uniref:uncharacterized protein LOC135809688 n=1 Tax=Sycon ciliatum TaxID=27933 RepID=UPI0031F6C43C|eukprot:scpid72740/ scgid28655/ 